MKKRILCFLGCIMLVVSPVFAQMSCPPNIDFENGNYGNWSFYTGSCCPISTPNFSGQVNNRHMLTSGTATDYYGGFPVVAPGGGSYSLKLGNAATGGQAERARYYVQVPAGVNNYSLIYRYAVVFENPNHTPSEQPRFEVKAFDSATAIPLPCNDFTYVASSNLPGFLNSPNAYGVKWKGWTTASIDLSGWAGHTIAVDFSVGDCAQGAHFGYGYLDMNCALFEVTNVNCNGSPTTNLNAPPGFQFYSWWNSNFSTQVGSGQNVAIPTPSASTQYHVILTPYSGYGCPDTLTTTVNVASLTLTGLTDTTICSGSSIQLNAGVVSNSPTVNYSWTPSAGLSCSNCASPVASPVQSTSYIVAVNDGNGCSKQDTVLLSVNDVGVSTSVQPVTCNGGSNGSATASASGGTAPYTYSWNTTPVQTGSSAVGLSAGTYIVTVTDANGCSASQNVTVTEPAPVNASISGSTDATCFGGFTGAASVTASGGTGAYSYSWNSTPLQTSATATGLSAGTYLVTVTDIYGCADTAMVSIIQPSPLAVTTNVMNPLCLGANNGSATAIPTGGTTPYSYSWSTSPTQQTAAASNLASGNYTVTVTDANGCIATASALISDPAIPVTASITGTSNVLCYGGSNGSATASAVGGAAPYIFLWSTTPAQTTATAMNLSAGTYSVTITDNNGCSATAAAVITEPAPALSVNVIGDTLLDCHSAANGTLTASVAGGTAPYTYSWSTIPVQTSASATGLGAGNYMVTVTDANGCTAVQSVTLTEPPALNAIVTANTSVSCFGAADASATAVATGGTGAYNYIWNTTPAQSTATASNLGAGTYTVTTTDANGCADTAIVTITEPAALTVSTGVANLNCLGSNNGTATAIVTGGTTPYTYAWNTTPIQTTATASGLTIGTYTVSVTDGNGCTGSASATILPPSTPVNVTVTGSTPVMCAGSATGTATATGSAGTPPYSYFWNTTPVQNTATATGLAAGTYMVTISDANGCGDTASVTITEPTTPIGVTIVNPTNISCYGGSDGSATASVTGGTAPYTYTWNTTPAQTTATASGLIAGAYTVNVTDANGCSTMQSVAISEPTQISINTTSAAVTCNSGTDGSVSALVVGGVTPYIYSWSSLPGQNTASVSGIGAGTYQLTLTDANGCTATSQAAVNEPVALTSTMSVANLFCTGGTSGSATVTPAGGTAPYSYSWNTSPVQVTATASNLGLGTYTVTITDANGCIATNIANIATPATPLSASIGNVLPVQCFNTPTGSATVVPAGGAAPYSYVWNTTPVQTVATASNLSAGTHTVTVTDNNGCTATASVNIVQPASGIQASINNTSPVSCNSSADGMATVAATGGAAPYVYSWNTTPSQTTSVASGLPAGTWVATVTDANGCADTQSVTITGPAALLGTLGPVTNVSCFGGSDGAATVTASGGTVPYTYSWNTTPIQSVSSATTLTAGTYIVTITDANDCTDTVSALISEPPALTATVSSQNVLCQGGTGSAAVIPVGGTAPYSYSWNTTPAQSAATVSGLLSGSYSVSVSDAMGCNVTINVNITAPANPLMVSINNSSPVTCFGGTDGTATGQVSGGTAPYSYLWNTATPQTTATASSLSTGSHIVTVTDANGCSDTANVMIGQPDEIVINLQTTKTCNGLSNGAATTIVTGGTSPYNIVWGTNPAQSGVNAVGLVAGIYTITVTDSLSCQKTSSFDIENFEGPQVNAGSDTTICDGSSLVLHASGASSYLWQADSTISCTACADPVVTPGETTIYSVTGVDNNGCTSIDMVTVSVIKKGPVAVDDKKEICAGEIVALSASGGDSYYWYPGTGLDRNSVPGPVANPATTTTYSVIIRQGSCFTDTLHQTVVVHDLPMIDLGPDYKGLAGDAYTIPVTHGNATGIEWLPALNLTCSDCFDPVATLATDITYVARVWNSLGCYAEDDFTIKVGCDKSVLFIPNTFTPNGDGANDFFFPRGRGMKKITRFEVYSRWGELIFDGKDVALNESVKGWDGTYKNQQLDPDVFVYVIEGICDNDEPVSVKGDITLLR